MPAEQNAQPARQGGAYDTLTHFMLIPLFLANFIVAIVFAVHNRGSEHALLHWWLVVVSLGLLLMAGKQRIYSLAVQDRVIRLEERLRIGALVPGADVYRLSMRQLIALRFASDAELPALVHRAISEEMAPKAIKEAITSWRFDDVRI